MIHKLFRVCQRAENPEVIAVFERVSGTTAYDTATLKGTHYRVNPQTSDEIFAIQMLDHRVDKFAPSNGDGIILTRSAIQKYA